MPKPKTAVEAYEYGLAQGLIHNISEVNQEKVRSLMQNAEINISSAAIIAKAIDSKAKEWMNVFTLHYEALRMYAEAVLHCEKIESPNHQCLFAALCIKFPHLSLDWEFLDRLRIKRNGLNYYGESITYADWKSVELPLNLYLSTLKKELANIL
ncbi:hypothetical protein HYX14_06350 [Candidatus Woesearchaeota archaeon]|nr:hypothetical protein [Candidatus Woesearchaeota archaeon]